VMITFGKCCNPVPGEPITGIITKGRGIVVHTNSCKNLLRLMQETDRIIDVSWDVEKGNRFLAGLFILGEKKNKLLSDIPQTVTAADCNIVSMNINAQNSLVSCNMSVEVYNLDHLNRLMSKIQKVDGVISVSRLNE